MKYWRGSQRPSVSEGLWLILISKTLTGYVFYPLIYQETTWQASKALGYGGMKFGQILLLEFGIPNSYGIQVNDEPIRRIQPSLLAAKTSLAARNKERRLYSRTEKSSKQDTVTKKNSQRLKVSLVLMRLKFILPHFRVKDTHVVSLRLSSRECFTSCPSTYSHKI